MSSNPRENPESAKLPVVGGFGNAEQRYYASGNVSALRSSSRAPRTLYKQPQQKRAAPLKPIPLDPSIPLTSVIDAVISRFATGASPVEVQIAGDERLAQQFRTSVELAVRQNRLKDSQADQIKLRYAEVLAVVEPPPEPPLEPVFVSIAPHKDPAYTPETPPAISVMTPAPPLLIGSGSPEDPDDAADDF